MHEQQSRQLCLRRPARLLKTHLPSGLTAAQLSEHVIKPILLVRKLRLEQ